MADDAQLRARVGARIRQARQDRGLSQSALAALIPGPVEGAYVSRWERGENMPSWPHLQALAAALQVPLDWLLRDDG